MADQQHLAVLKQGVAAWNAWRRQHPEIHPDLREADLSEATLNEANLREALLLGADLSGDSLSRAGLHETDFRRGEPKPSGHYQKVVAATSSVPIRK